MPDFPLGLRCLSPTRWLTLALFAQLGEHFVAYGIWGLALVSFMESSFFPVPPDFIQIALTLPFLDSHSPQYNPGMAFTFAGISMVASVTGSLLGWAIGRYAGESFFTWLMRKGILKRASFDHAIALLQRYDMGAIMVAAFTPIPYKVFTIASGVSRMPLWRLVLASIIGRGGRFFLVAALLYWQGEAALGLLEGKGFALLTLGIAAVVVLVAWVMYRLRRAPQGADTHTETAAGGPTLP